MQTLFCGDTGGVVEGGRSSHHGREPSPCYPLPRMSLPNLWDDSHFAAEEIEVIWFIHTF